MRLQIASQSASGRSKAVNAERLVNMYAEQADGKSNVALHGTPGLLLDAIYGAGPIRGIRFMSGTRYVVSGNRLYNALGSVLGVVNGSGPVSMADNGEQLVIVTSANTGYVYSLSGGLVTITDPDWPGATSVDYLDGYFLFTEPNSGIFFISALNDATDIDALDFASAESAPDHLVRVFVDHREVWLMGVDTCEIWVNTGDGDFPFERQPGAITEKGLRGKFTVSKADNSIYWVDRDGIVRRAAEAYSPVRVSTHAVEHQIAKGDLDNAEAFTYAQEGHEFYCLTVPNAGTFVYDAATGLWHERESYGQGRWRASGFARESGVQYVGDYQSGNVYRLDLDTYTENGVEQVAEMVFPPIQADGERFILGSVRLDMESGDATNAKVMLQVSRDGRTWSDENWQPFGDVGDYAKRVIWRRLGQYDTCHLRFRISDNAKRAVFAAYAVLT
jgi:hypothetical protein